MLEDIISNLQAAPKSRTIAIMQKQKSYEQSENYMPFFLQYMHLYIFTEILTFIQGRTSTEKQYIYTELRAPKRYHTNNQKITGYRAIRIAIYASSVIDGDFHIHTEANKIQREAIECNYVA